MGMSFLKYPVALAIKLVMPLTVLSAGLILCLSVSAQPPTNITVKATVPSLAILAPGTPGHEAFVARMQVRPLLEAVGPIAPYLHVLHNTGQQTITGMTLAYEVTDAEGRTTKRVTSYVRLHFQPGDQKFIAPPPFDNLASAVNRRSTNALSVLLPRLRNTPLPASVALTVDHVEFADRTSEGPDNTQMASLLAQRSQQLSAFFQELLTRAAGPEADQGLVGWLQSLHHQQTAAGQPPDIAGASVEAKAHTAISLLQGQGRSKLITWAQAQAIGCCMY